MNYILKDNKIYNFFLFILFLTAEMYFLFLAPERNDRSIPIIILWFLIILCFHEFGRKIRIDLETKIIEESYWGILHKRQFKFNKISRFVISRHKLYGLISSGYSLSLEYSEDGYNKHFIIKRSNELAIINKLTKETSELVKL